LAQTGTFPENLTPDTRPTEEGQDFGVSIFGENVRQKKYNILGQNVPVWAKMCHFGPLCALLCRNVPLCAKMCHFVPKCATLCSFVPKCAKLGQVGPKCAALCRFVPFCATLCQVGPKSLQSSPKDLLIPYYIFLRDTVTCKNVATTGGSNQLILQKVAKSYKVSRKAA
jgi:hypothetical protein